MERTDADEPKARRAALLAPAIEDADRKEAGAAAAAAAASPVNEATAFAPPLTRTARREAAGTKAWVTVRNINAADAMARYVMAWGAGLILPPKEISLSDESVG